jgi:hypothetical protein
LIFAPQNESHQFHNAFKPPLHVVYGNVLPQGNQMISGDPHPSETEIRQSRFLPPKFKTQLHRKFCALATFNNPF